MNTALEQTIHYQIRAASPEISAWVTANAGSGKTHVLINRVARLLLAGADPSRILCITYTRAAAAEMAERLFKLLGEWALEDDAALAEILLKLEGSGAELRSGEGLSRARRLFARALETPGGLKIQTIHAFCSHVLKRFPLEAGVPPGFGEMEQAEATTLINTALDLCADDANRDQSLAEALYHLGLTFGAGRLGELLHSLINKRQYFDTVLDQPDSVKSVVAQLAESFSILPDTTAAEITDAAVAHFPVPKIRAAAATLMSGGARAQKDSATLKDAASITDNTLRYHRLAGYFLTNAGTGRKSLIDKKIKGVDPALDEHLSEICDVFVEANTILRSVAIIQDTKHFLTVAQHLLGHYEKLKWTKGVLDFDDLIIRVRNLFARGEHGARWVMYKLDNGLEHILVDEAQDTSPAQWSVIEGPLAEFFAGIETRDHPRTLFVVGDEKQSIYSFQGADACLLRAKSIELGKKIAAVAAYDHIALTLSFRSTAPVLNFVDAAFADESAMEGMGDVLPLRHDFKRIGDAGVVELWPLVPKPEKPETNPWDAPIDAQPANNPVTQLCDQVAITIAGWLENRELLSAKGRAISSGDILILVQKRGALFRQMIKSLTRQRIRVAGADRLALLSEIAIQDLLSYAQCVLLPEDDLSLAEILKSPLFGFDDEDLFALANARKTSLWAALCARHGEHPHWHDAYSEISAAKEIGLGHGAYDFYAFVLDKGGMEHQKPCGRERFFARLGRACSDAIDAFIRLILDYEAKHPRSLQGFVSWFEENAGEIKRQLDQESDSVRIMTVHGAKGLESNIVFLLDAHEGPAAGKMDPIFSLSPAHFQPIEGDVARASISDPLPLLPVLVRTSGGHNDVTSKALEHRKELVYEEYRRLFYVAATRAKDRLYICGLEKRKPKDASKVKAEDQPPYNTQSWYELASKGFDVLKQGGQPVTPMMPLPWEGEGWCLECPQTAPIESKKSENIAGDTAPPGDVAISSTLPAWFRTPCEIEKPVEHLAPSTLADRHEQGATGKGRTVPAGYSPIDGVGRFVRGKALHRLLEVLPDHPAKEHRAIADRLLLSLAGDVDIETRAAWREEVLRVLGDRDFAPVFAAGSRAEVSIGGTPPGARASITINGQIDRLAVSATEVLIIDYKTNQPPPACERDVADAYLAQMAAYRGLIRALYPQKRIKTGLLWTYEARLMMLSDKLLDHAFTRFLA